MNINEQLKNALSDSRPTLVEFYSDNCSRCAAMMPIVSQLKEEMGDRCNIIQIEGYQHPDIRTEYHVHSCPCWILFKDGQEVWRDCGQKPYHELKDMIDRFI